MLMFRRIAFVLALLIAWGGCHANAQSSETAKEQQQSTELPPWPIYAYWSFDADKDQDDASIVRDLGPNELHGTFKTDNDTPIQRVQGLRGEALRFPPEHQSWVALDKRFKLEPPFTIAVWVKPQTRRASMDLLGHKAHSWREGWRFVFSLRRMFLEYSDGKENIQVRRDQHQAQEGQWTFVAAVHDGEHISLHVDGQEVQKEPATKAVISKHQAILGNYVVDKKTYGFIGDMDEFIILQQALTTDELVKLGQWTRNQ